jgi:RNA polymerase sigma factor (sigma-70 family)
MSSADLLQRYARDRDQAAFSEFVQQHFDLVYSAALRQAAHDPHLAHDIAQAVFLVTAQHADALSRHPALVGWLYTATRHQTARHIRAQRRWQSREQKAHAMKDVSDTTPPADELWQQLRPLLDDALHALNAREREAILLRYFEGRAYPEIGRQLGLAENSARMRVDRALEKVRHQLSRRGLTSTAVALSTVLGSYAVHAAPAGLALQTAAAIHQTAAPATLFATLLLKLQLMNSLKLTALTLTFVSATAYGLIAATSTSAPIHVEQKTVPHVERKEMRTATAALASNTSAPQTNAVVSGQTAKNSEPKPSNEILFLQREGKIWLTEAFAKRFELTSDEKETIQKHIKRAWDELDACAAKNASVQVLAPGKALLTINSFGEGADIYDRVLASIAGTLGTNRNQAFLNSTASALEHSLKYCGATTRTFTVTKAFTSEGKFLDYEVVDTWTSAYQRRGKGTRRYKTREAFSLDYPHLAKLLPADFQ